jgi:hypothetical protein
VKAEIDWRDVKNELNLSILIKTVQDAVPPIRDKGNERTLAQDEFDLVNVAQLWARADDFAAASKTAEPTQDPSFRRLALELIKSQMDRVSAARSEPIVQPAVRDWLHILDQDNKGVIHGSCALNTDPFLDVAAYLKSSAGIFASYDR